DTRDEQLRLGQRSQDVVACQRVSPKPRGLTRVRLLGHSFSMVRSLRSHADRQFWSSAASASVLDIQGVTAGALVDLRESPRAVAERRILRRLLTTSHPPSDRIAVVLLGGPESTTTRSAHTRQARIEVPCVAARRASIVKCLSATP